MANQLGLIYPGPQSELQDRIEAILANQMADWHANIQYKPILHKTSNINEFNILEY